MSDFPFKDMLPMIREHASWLLKPIGVLSGVAVIVVLVAIIAIAPAYVRNQWRSPPGTLQDGTAAHPFDNVAKCPADSFACYDCDISGGKIGVQTKGGPKVCFVRTKIHGNDKNVNIQK